MLKIEDFAFEFVWIPPGEFQMGSPENEPGRYENEKNHPVALTAGFWMNKYSVTQGQWKVIMNGENPSYFQKGDNYPVERISWNDCLEFIKKLNEMNKVKGIFRLPSEAEWEYACRAGKTTQYYDSGFKDDNYCWNDLNSNDSIQPVMQKKPNAWGLYDMSGNVWEWCSDWYGDYPDGTMIDPVGPAYGSTRIVRGGSWTNSAMCCRPARRYSFDPSSKYFNIGFRIVMAPDK